jgi:transaldolase
MPNGLRAGNLVETARATASSTPTGRGREGKPDLARAREELFLELAIEDLRRAADAFLPIHERADGVAGVDVTELAARLQADGAKQFVAAWTT